MSQMEQKFRVFLSKNPEIELCYQKGLINRRSLARHLVRKGVAESEKMEALIAMIRRFDFQAKEQAKDLFSKIRVNIKDKIIILDFQKEKELIQSLYHLIDNIDYDHGDTLKIVIGSRSVKVFLDEENEKNVKNIIGNFKIQNRLINISEMSIMFTDDANRERGILSTLTRELSVNGIVIDEFLTASPELLIYLREEFVLTAYDIIKRLQKT